MLDALSSPARLKIVKSLRNQNLSYTDLMKAIGLSKGQDAGKFSYHLKKLLKTGIITIDNETKLYAITRLGDTLLKILEEMEEIDTTHLYVRKSQFVIEVYDKNKIINALVKEAGAPVSLAKQVADVIDEKIKNLKIEYLTAPLIREIANAVLIDLGHEKYRHKLTRVGLPLYDISKLINSISMNEIHNIIKDTSGAVLREYTLLEILPRNVADAHLAGKINIDNLDFWLVKPYRVFYSSNLLNKFINENDEILIEKFLFYINEEAEKIDYEQSINNFSSFLLNLNKNSGEYNFKKNLYKIFYFLLSQRKKENPKLFISLTDQNLYEKIDFFKEIMETIKKINNEFLDKINLIDKCRFMIPFEEIKIEDGIENIHLIDFLIRKNERKALYGGGGLTIYSGEKVYGSFTINIPRIFYESKGNEEKFHSEVEEVFKTCYKGFLSLAKLLIDKGIKEKINFSISLVGVYETIKALTNGNPAENKDSLNYLIKFFRWIDTFTRKNSSKNIEILLSSSSSIGTMKRFILNDIQQYGIKKVSQIAYKEENLAYSNFIIPAEEEIDIEKRLEMEAVLHTYLRGGHYTIIPVNDVEIIHRFFERKNLFSSLETISFGHNLFFCEKCKHYSFSSKCQSCNSEKQLKYIKDGSYFSSS
ncbi:MAG: anaerobic ribonucleoside-triphosphate reductase [Nitrososphaerota archaeon]